MPARHSSDFDRYAPLVTAAELARLRRVEAIARDVRGCFRYNETYNGETMARLDALSHAIDGTPLALDAALAEGVAP